MVNIVQNSRLHESKFFHVIDEMAPVGSFFDKNVEASYCEDVTFHHPHWLESYNYGSIDSNNKPAKIKEKGFSDAQGIKQSDKF